jgi:chemotaxis response regulator CheB
VTGRDIVVVGASAGGLRALRRLLEPLPPDLPAAVFVVLHRTASPMPLEVLLPKAKWPLPFQWAVEGERFSHGRVYVAPPDRHLLIERGRTRLEHGPKERWFRPAIDALFRSAALAYGRRVVGVVLSGMLTDGTAGLWEIRKRGGMTIVQDPKDAEHRSMPESALANVPIDHCLPADEIGRALVDLTRPIDRPRAAAVLIVEDERIVAMNLEARLRELGYEVAGSVASGEAAIETAARTGPDVVLMDIHLSGPTTGTQAARSIWERWQIPIVYVTAYSDDDTLDEVKTTEAYGYVVKPFRPEDVHVAIQLALERRSRETRES